MARLITDILGELESGLIVAEMSTALAELTDAVRQTRKAGTITLKLTLRPNGDSVLAKGEVKLALPPMARNETVYFVDAAGNLVRNDPRQPDLPLRRVEAATPADVAAEA